MIYEDIIKEIPKENIYVNEKMSKHTSFRVGGTADYYIEIETIAQLIYILKLAKSLKIKTQILGNGTNVIVKDEGFRGIIIKPKFNHLNIEKDVIIAGSGVPVSLLSNFAYTNEIKGYEFLSGIPGSVGGAVKMNAGAYGSEIKNVLVNTTYLDEKMNIRKLNNDEHNFKYRKSIFFDKKWIIIGSTFKIEKGDKDEIKQKREEYTNSRKEKQPLDMPNAGSIFKRTDDCIPAMLIDKAGLKGYKIGGAQISEKHAGFIVNTGNATAEDIIKLIKYTKEVIKKQFDKELEEEVIIL